MKYLKLLLPIILLVTVSCTTIRPNILLESGRPLANPNYVLHDIGDTELKITFWFTTFTTITDKDRTVINIPKTLDMQMDHILRGVKKVTVSVEVYNPKNVIYRITCDVKSISLKDNKRVPGQISSLAAISDLTYRRHTIDLPYDENLLSATFSGIVYSDDSAIFMIGPFHYERRVKQVRVPQTH